MAEHALPAGPQTMSPELAHAPRLYRWLFDAIEPHLGDSVLDIGGGYGSHLESILDSGRSIVSLDLSQEAVDSMRERFAGQARFDALCGDFADPATVETLRARSCDTIVCLNVLEHIEDDAAALANMARLLGHGGTLVLQVPAHPWLYGQLDALAGHHRRYTWDSLHELIVAAGFEDPELFFFNRFGVLPWWVNGRLLKPKTIEAESVATQVRLFDRFLVPVARAVDRVLPLPFGQSLFAVARVPSELPC